jgi:hypothetical protein
MNPSKTSLADLAARAEQGDERARRQLLQALAPALKRLARVAVETSEAAPLLQRIRAVAQRLTDGNAAACDPANLAHDLGRLIAARIHPSPTEVAAPTLLSA